MTTREAREHNAKLIERLCAEHGCNEKKREIHFEQMVNRAWNPHPGASFVRWWKTQPEFREDGIDAVRARNCKVFCDRYKEARAYGIA